MPEFEGKNLIVMLGEEVYQLDSVDELIETLQYKVPMVYDDEFTSFLSLCKLGVLQILEEKDANIFTAGMDKSKMEDNYIFVNKFADELLKMHKNKEN